MNLTGHVTDKIEVGTNLNLARINNNDSPRSGKPLANGGTILGALTQIPVIPVREKDGSYGTNPYLKLDNPIANIKETNYKIGLSKIVGNIHAKYDILPNLFLKTKLGLNYRSQIGNQYETRELPGKIGIGVGQTGTESYTSWLWQSTITYVKPFLKIVI